MTKNDIIAKLISMGYNNDASATQQDLYTTIKRGQLFSNSNRLNAGWARGKYLVASIDDSSYTEQEYVTQWISKVSRYQDQYLCLEMHKDTWVFYDYLGNQIPFIVKPPQLPQIKGDFNLDNTKTNMTISNRYRSYITAIKSKPFLLLAGISGTGKSRIVRELARACWDVGLEEYEAQRPRNFEMVQVKPNWHDSSELIGYVSRIGVDADGKPCPVFVAGDFLKFIAKAWAEPNVPYFLCLDEMNLAPVEQYFAEYLSVIESRKVNEDGEITTDPIVKKCEERWYHPLAAELARDEATRTRFLKDGICIPQNLIVVGTVNMDETTFSFSRKVLDRAMTIEMNEVDLKGGLSHRHEQIGKLGTAELIGNAVEGVDVYKDNQKACEIAISYLESINVKLEGTPFKIAYRARNETLLYVVNNLPYNKDKDGNELKQEYVIARALDEITNMKILSRIEGDETKVNSKFLEELDGTIKSGLETICPTLFTDDGYVSVSSSKLDEMKQRLASGYTSFWS